MQPVFIIHSAEISLKGGNRGFFENTLQNNLQQAVGGFKVQKIPAGFVVLSEGEGHDSAALAALKKVFGCAVIFLAWEIEGYDLESIIVGAREALSFRQCHCEDPALDAGDEAIPKLLRLPRRLRRLAMTNMGLPECPGVKTFSVSVQRSDKNFPQNSMEIAQVVGREIKKITGWQVDLKNPDATLFVEIVNRRIFLGWQKLAGVGGLPVGTAGRVLVMLSGGIDSPLAAWRIMRRGAICDFVHFHSYPQTNRRSIEKVKRLFEVLNSWQTKKPQYHNSHDRESCGTGSEGGKLFLEEFLPFQKKVLAQADMEYAVILYRREMLRHANELAKKCGAQAIVTGDSLGQVASQTMENLAVVSEASGLPIFRPLISFDKQDIVREAQTIGTYEISIEPHEDCCSLFVPRHPKTKARLQDVLEQERRLSQNK